MTHRQYAPGRAELLGNHTDYNDGTVLSIAVDFGTTLEGSAREDGRIVIHSKNLGETYEGRADRIEPSSDRPWANYLLGVVDELAKRGIRTGGFEVTVDSNIPLGAGLSSSAALEVATARFLQQIYPYELGAIDMARVAQAAEHRYAGVKCGLLDQISSLMGKAGHVTHIDCRSYEVTHLPLPPGVAFVIVHSGVKHALVSGEYNERRESCEEAARLLGRNALREVSMAELEAARGRLPDRIWRRACHVVGEIERVEQGSRFLRSGDAASFGSLMTASHESSRMNFENSCPELDFLVATAVALPGCLGARLSGGGFGGATIQLVETGRVAAFAESVRTAYAATHGREALVLTTSAAAGAL
jgi:galactokinase